MTDSAIELDHVVAHRATGRGALEVVHDLSLSLQANEFVALMGPSGSGKSSIIYLACGLLKPTSGRVGVNGQWVQPSSWATIRRRTIGVVHQRLDLLDGIDVLDNVALPLLLDGVRVTEAQRQARAAMERLGIDSLSGALPQEFSVGEQQLVAVARAVVGERKIVLADEPTAALDTLSAERVVGVLADLADSGLVVLMATHDARMATWAQRVEHLRDGALTSNALHTSVSGGVS